VTSAIESATHTAPHIYNLFPRLAGDARTWPEHAERARAMGFDWLYLNPVHFPGFSGSCYAVSDYRRVDPVVLPDGHPDKHYEPGLRGDGGGAILREALTRIRNLGLRPIMDLVINHTAQDSPLVATHPQWYVRAADGTVRSPSAIDPADARRITVWGDLAEVDNHASPDRDALWDFWTRLVEDSVRLGFRGFRCDAAYKVPAALWARLRAAAQALDPEVAFFGETLGARLEEVAALWEARFDFVFNSSKYWAFDAPWCLEQQASQPDHVRSVSFPESHDTPRLWAETGGNAAVQRQRYAFAAGFASGVMMPMGFEYGFARRLDVVHTRPESWEEPAVDLSDFIARVHAARRRYPALGSERVHAAGELDAATLLLAKEGTRRTAHVAINKDWHCSHALDLPEAARGARVLRVCRADADADEAAGRKLDLAPAEVVYLV
jgi:starch synthase (maltosyl-transferring)